MAIFNSYVKLPEGSSFNPNKSLVNVCQCPLLASWRQPPPARAAWRSDNAVLICAITMPTACLLPARPLNFAPHFQWMQIVLLGNKGSNRKIINQKGAEAVSYLLHPPRQRTLRDGVFATAEPPRKHNQDHIHANMTLLLLS